MDRDTQKLQGGTSVRMVQIGSVVATALVLTACSPVRTVTSAVGAVGSAATSAVTAVGSTAVGAATTVGGAAVGAATTVAGGAVAAGGAAVTAANAGAAGAGAGAGAGGGTGAAALPLEPTAAAGAAAAANSASNLDQQPDAQQDARTDALATQLSKQIIAGMLFCTRLEKEEYRIDCFADKLDQAARDVPDDVDLGPARSILADTAAKLAGVVEENASNDLRPVTLTSNTGPGSSRTIKAVKTEALPTALAQAEVILQEAETLLLRSSEASSRRKLAYVRISEAVGSSKVLLRSA